ncbi:hypothetical protein L1987_25097 [Smallanthus sonchifolius]|uniref:Uncharacterized protein n=1 Tax=Smallanthus sonchifolius TaxID=185202 RepID=A0ACB9IN79_9ASTR|nr:hypothetical protein L1987_25097 [Smallanthus sonchifolius]
MERYILICTGWNEDKTIVGDNFGQVKRGDNVEVNDELVGDGVDQTHVNDKAVEGTHLEGLDLNETILDMNDQGLDLNDKLVDDEGIDVNDQGLNRNDKVVNDEGVDVNDPGLNGNDMAVNNEGVDVNDQGLTGNDERFNNNDQVTFDAPFVQEDEAMDHVLFHNEDFEYDFEAANFEKEFPLTKSETSSKGKGAKGAEAGGKARGKQRGLKKVGKVLGFEELFGMHLQFYITIGMQFSFWYASVWYASAIAIGMQFSLKPNSLQFSMWYASAITFQLICVIFGGFPQLTFDNLLNILTSVVFTTQTPPTVDVSTLLSLLLSLSIPPLLNHLQDSIFSIMDLWVFVSFLT